jgi:hypothetical protein
MGIGHSADLGYKVGRDYVKRSKTLIEFQDAAGGSVLATTDGAATITKYYVFPTASHDHFNLNDTTTSVKIFWDGAVTIKGRIQVICADGSGTLAGSSMSLYAEWTNSGGTADEPTIPIAHKTAYACATTGLEYEFVFDYTVAIPDHADDVWQTLKLRFEFVQTAGVAAGVDSYGFDTNNYVIIQHHPEAEF